MQCLRQPWRSFLTRCWNPCPKRGSPGAICNHIAGWWHILALQESAEFHRIEHITCQFHALIFFVAVHSSTNIRFNLILKSSRFTCQPTRHTVTSRLSRPFLFSTHSQERHVQFHDNVAALPQRGCSKTQHAVNVVLYSPNCDGTWWRRFDMGPGDFNGASWRSKLGPEEQFDITLEEGSKKPGLRATRLLTFVEPWWNPSEWTDVCGFVKPPTKAPCVWNRAWTAQGKDQTPLSDMDPPRVIKTSPCVRAERPREACWELHTVFSTFFQRAAQHRHKTPQDHTNNTQHTQHTQHNTQHNNTTTTHNTHHTTDTTDTTTPHTTPQQHNNTTKTTTRNNKSQQHNITHNIIYNITHNITRNINKHHTTTQQHNNNTTTQTQ